MKKLLLILTLALLASCSFWDTNVTIAPESHSSFIINLIDSTCIIRTLISQNKMSDVLEDHNSEQLALLLDNTSPAQMAFESEVFSTTIPLVVVYYFQETKESYDFIKKLEHLVSKYDEQIKFVLVDVQRLFSLAQDAQIEILPTVLIVQDRKVIDRLEGDLGNQFEEKLATYMKLLSE